MTTNKAAEALHPSAERWARMFHDAYELAAPLFGYETREASRKPWDQVPENNRALMTAVAGYVGALIIAEATAQQAAEAARLRENWYVAARAYHRSAHIPRYSTHGPWFQDCNDLLCVDARAALAAAPAVAPDPAPPAPDERCEDCAGNFVDGYCRRHEPSFHGYNGAVSVPEPAP